MGGGELTLCQTQGTYEIGVSTSMKPCFTERDIFFSDKQWAWVEGQAYKLAAQVN